MLVINNEIWWMYEKAKAILESGKKIVGINNEDKYIYTIAMLAYRHLYGDKGKSTYIKLFKDYKEIHVGINGHWKDIIVGEEKEGVLKVRDKDEVSEFIKALEYKIYDEVYQAAIARIDYLVNSTSEEFSTVVDNIDNEAQIELTNKLSISNLRSEYLEAMDKWKIACKDLKLGGYKCEVDNHPAYTKWQGMLNRAYGASSSKWYDNVTVSESFKHYPIFKQWYLTQYLEEGWELDKDLLLKGNKVYCASRCCFLPKEINSALAINRSLIPALAEKYRKVLNNDIYKALLLFTGN
jgi:hypothetical protein